MEMIIPLDYQTLNNIWIDETITQAPWKAFIQKLQEDWKELILNVSSTFTLIWLMFNDCVKQSTVLLAANTALLAVPSVDSGSNNKHRSATQIISYTSIVASIGSVIIGLLLIWYVLLA
jgi:hypothetical protein